MFIKCCWQICFWLVDYRNNPSSNLKFHYSRLQPFLLLPIRLRLDTFCISLTDSVQESLNQWLSKTQNFLHEVTSPLVKTVNDRRSTLRDHAEDVDEIFLSEQTVDRKTPNGDLSLAAILSIEQFSRWGCLNWFFALIWFMLWGYKKITWCKQPAISPCLNLPQKISHTWIECNITRVFTWGEFNPFFGNT